MRKNTKEDITSNHGLMFMLAMMGVFSLFFIPSCMQAQSQEVTTINSKEKQHDN